MLLGNNIAHGINNPSFSWGSAKEPLCGQVFYVLFGDKNAQKYQYSSFYTKLHSMLLLNEFDFLLYGINKSMSHLETKLLS